MKSRVFVTQQHMTRDEGGAWRPKFDLSPATEYGELHFIFGAGQIALQPEAVNDAIEERLDELQFDPAQDYLLATGDLVLGAVTYYRMMQRGGCRMLRWDGRYRRYNVFTGE